MNAKNTTRLLPMEELLSRPCEVDGVPALFHRWVEEDRALLNIETFLRHGDQEALRRRALVDGVVPCGCSVDVIREMFALVEYQDGTIAKVDPELIRFLDREVPEE